MFRKLKRAFAEKRRRYELAVGMGLLAAMAFVRFSQILLPIEYLTVDLRFRLRPEIPFPSGIMVAGIDEASLDVLGRWPWPRNYHAALLNLLRHEPFRPLAIGYDALFEDHNTLNLKGDEDLVHYAGELKQKVVMAYFFEKGPASIYERNEQKEEYLKRFAISHVIRPPAKLDRADKVSLPFWELASTTRLGFVNTPVDPDGRTRRARLLMRYDGRIYPSMDVLLILSHLGADVEDLYLYPRKIVVKRDGRILKEIPITDEGDMWMNYYGPAKNIPMLSFLSLLDDGRRWMEGEKPAYLPLLKDKLLLVGVTALGIGDRRVTPFFRYETGINLHAQVLANILEERYLRQAPPWIGYATLFVIGTVTILITMFRPITRSLPYTLGLAVIYFFIAQLFFNAGVWIDVAVPQAALAVIFVGITSFRYFTALEELKRTQEQLIHAAKMSSLGQLSAGIAHEFRNILNSIGLHIEYCTRPGTNLQDVPKYLQRVQGIMKNANEILTGLLTFARKNESVRCPGDLRKTVEETMLLIEKEMSHHGIEVVREFEDVPEVAFDKGQISQVLINLINNARDAMDGQEDKEIRIRLKNAGDHILIEITDNGPGIPKEVQKRLFEPFVTTKTAGKGTGLGLSVCHGIIRNHGGDIRVTTAAGKGTTWHILLPR